MGLRDEVVKQFVRPSGVLGRVTGSWMACKNAERNRWAVAQLGLRPTDTVLEIGFGPGVAIEALARAVPNGHVYGIDYSSVMVRAATARNAETVRSGRVTLALGAVDDLPAYDEPFHAILAINNAWMWPDLPTRVKELRGLLRNGGRLALVTQPRNKGANAHTSRAVARENEQLLDGAGYSEIRTETLALDPPVVCVLGVNPTTD
jgi:ubiquinone/menaquinone biosynthesis C-methylase UbiE